MPPADMTPMHSQYMAGQAASAVEYAGQSSSVQQTMQNMYAASAMGAQTATQGVQMAAGSVYNGASSALGQAYAVAQGAGAMFQPPVGVPSPEGGMGVVDAVHGVAAGGLAVAGGLGGFMAFDALQGGASAATGGIWKSMVGAGRAGLAQGGLGGAARGAAGFMGVGAAAMALPVAAGMAIDKAVSIGTEQMNAIRDINSTMANNQGRFGFFDANITSPGESNFRRTAESITNYVGNIQEIGRGQAGRFVEGAMQMGLFEGAAGEGGEGITGRAKKLADAIKESSRLLNTSMEESLQVMGELRQAGFRDPIGAATSTMMGNRGMARATGGEFSAEQMHGYGMQQAMQFRGAGVAGEFGYSAATQNLTTATVMMQQNAMPDWLAMNLGGKQGVAQVMQQSLGAFMQSGLGQMNVIAQAQGVAGGNLNQMAGAASGQLQNSFQAAQTFGNMGQMMEEQGPQMMQAMQARSLLNIGQQVMGNEFGQAGAEKQVTALTGMLSRNQGLMQQFGVQDVNQARALATFAIQGGDALKQQSMARRQEMENSVTEDYMARNYGVGGAIYQAKGAMQRFGQRTIGEPVGDVYASIAGTAQELEQDVGHWWYGTQKEMVGGNMEDLAGGMAERFLKGNAADTAVNARGGRYTGALVTGEEQFERMREAGRTQRVHVKDYIRNKERYVVAGGSEAARLAGRDMLSTKNLAMDQLFSGRGLWAAATGQTGAATMEAMTVEVADIGAVEASNQSASRVRLAAQKGVDQNDVFDAALSEALKSGDAQLQWGSGQGLLTGMMQDATGAERNRLQTFRDAFASNVKRRVGGGRATLSGMARSYREGGGGAPSAADLIGAATESKVFRAAMGVEGASPESALAETLRTQGIDVGEDTGMQKALGAFDVQAQERNSNTQQDEAMNDIASFMFGKQETVTVARGVDVDYSRQGAGWAAMTGGNKRYVQETRKGRVDFSSGLGAEQQKYLRENLGRLTEIGRLMESGEEKDAFKMAETFRSGLGEGATVLTTDIMNMAKDQHSSVSRAARTAQSVWEDTATRRWMRGMKFAASEVDFSKVKDSSMKRDLTGFMTGLTSAAGLGTEKMRNFLNEQEEFINENANILVDSLSKQGSSGRSLAALVKGKIGKQGDQDRALSAEEVEEAIKIGDDVTGARTRAVDPGHQAGIEAVTREMFANMKSERQALQQMAGAMGMMQEQLEAMKGGGRVSVAPVATPGQRGRAR